LGQGFSELIKKININDTSIVGRQTTEGRVKGKPEAMFRINIFRVDE